MDTTNMTELITYVNSQLTKELSIAKIEKDLGFGKDTLRRKIIREGYIFNKNIHQFIIDTNNHVTHKSTYNITHDKPSNSNTSDNITRTITHDTTHDNKSTITQAITHNVTHEKIGSKSERVLTNEDFQILFNMIDLYKDNQNKKDTPNQNLEDKKIIIDRKEEEVTTRSFRSYKKVFELFSEYCTTNKLNQKDAIADALLSFINN